jgi:hypothetical protein
MATRITAPKTPTDAAIDDVASKTTLSTLVPAIVAALRAIRDEMRRQR